MIALALIPACADGPLPPENADVSASAQQQSRRAGQGESCLEGQECRSGLTCMTYVGVGGNTLATCELPCGPADECPANQGCMMIADGPGQVCRPIPRDGGNAATESLPQQGEPCPEDRCADGLACLEYYGIAGPRGGTFTSCEIRCTADESCPEEQQCVTIADGPGQVCRPSDRP